MDRRSKVLQAQFRKATSAPDEFIKYYMSDDCGTWYILLSGFPGDDNEFAGGQYLVKMVAPTPGADLERNPGFPYEPPHFYFYTPNGVYGTHRKVCVSIGEFHKADYRAALGMHGFAKQLISGMIGWRTLGSGIAILSTSVETKRKYAEESAQFNQENHEDILAKITECYSAYSSKWKETGGRRS